MTELEVKELEKKIFSDLALCFFGKGWLFNSEPIPVLEDHYRSIFKDAFPENEVVSFEADGPAGLIIFNHAVNFIKDDE